MDEENEDDDMGSVVGWDSDDCVVPPALIRMMGLLLLPGLWRIWGVAMEEFKLLRGGMRGEAVGGGLGFGGDVALVLLLFPAAFIATGRCVVIRPCLCT